MSNVQWMGLAADVLACLTVAIIALLLAWNLYHREQQEKRERVREYRRWTRETGWPVPGEPF